MSDVELPPVFSPDHGEHLDEAMIAMRLKLLGFLYFFLFIDYNL